MPFNLLSQQTFSVDASGSTEALDYLFNCPSQVTVPIGPWFDTGVLNLSFSAKLVLTPGDYSGDRNFINPTAYQGGHLAVLESGYVLRDFPLRYEKQLYRHELPPIAINDSNSTFPLALGRTRNSRFDHATSIGVVPICGNVTNSPAAIPFNFTSATIPDGSICLRIWKGQEEYTQLETKLFTGNEQLQLDLGNYSSVISLSGIVRAGFKLTVVTSYSYLSETSGVLTRNQAQLIAGDAKFPIYGYSCSLGVARPLPSNPPCPPGQTGAVGPNGTVICNPN